MPADQRIRELCHRATLTQDDQELNVLLAELRTSLRECVQSTENLGIHLILNAPKAQAF
jgi:hypothetical protein